MSYLSCRRAGRPRAKSASISHSLQQNFLFITHERTKEETVLRVLSEREKEERKEIYGTDKCPGTSCACARGREGGKGTDGGGSDSIDDLASRIHPSARLLLRRYQNARKGVDRKRPRKEGGSCQNSMLGSSKVENCGPYFGRPKKLRSSFAK